MKARNFTLLPFLLVAFYLSSTGQGRQFITNINSNGNTTPFPVLVDTPIGYSTSGIKYPLLVFLHGTGEASNTAYNDANYVAGKDLGNIYNSSGAGGPAYFIAHGQWPDSFAHPITGKFYHFIVISPQAPGWSTASNQLKYIIDNFIAAGYRVDPDRIYLTGLSAGGQGVVEYSASISTTPDYKPAALVPMSMAQGATPAGAANIVADDISTWGFGQTTVNADVHGVATSDEVTYMNNILPGFARFTNYSGTSPHCCWNTFYNPTYRETINGKSMNIYEWMLLSDRSSTATPPPATVPFSVSAGSDQAITLPTNQVTLNGSATPSTGHSISAYLWTKISGGGASITLSDKPSTTVTGLSQGNYVFQLLAIDNLTVSLSSTVKVTVNPAPVVTVPTANAGTDQSITLPVSQVTLDAAASTVTNGTISTYEWVEKSGPTTAAITAGGSASTTVTGLAAGTYVFQLTITDNTGNKSTATVNVVVSPAVAPPVVTVPTANAGTDQSITLPVSQVTLDAGASTVTNGTISTYEWIEKSGPTTAAITAGGSASTTVTGLAAGTYVFQLTITDNTGNKSTATVNVVVSPAVAPPVVTVPTANAGTDQSITLPVSQVTLDAAASTVTNGTISTYEWIEKSGPTTAAITAGGSASTTVTGLAAGTYVFQLTITDNTGNKSTATVNVVVSPAVAPPVVTVPTANAGTDQSITLPVSQVTLDAAASTVTNGTISTYEWVEKSGPTTAAITAGASASTTVTGLAAGTYVFQLTITDNTGNKSTATVNVVVNAAVITSPPPPLHSSCGGQRRVLSLSANDQGKWITPATQTINPGDTVIINSKYRWSYLSGDGYHGTESCPIVIMNDTGQVELTAGIAFSNSTHMHITGTGSANHFYGFYIHSYDSIPALSRGNSLQFSDRSAFCEIDHIDEYMKTYCMWLKEEAQCADSLRWPNWRLDNFSIHDIRAKNISQDGFYIGSTSPNGERAISCNGTTISPIPMRVSNIHLYNIILDSVGRTGIQISGGDSGVNEINNCHVTRTGFEFNPTQGSGIILGGYTTGYVHDNYIRQTYQHGISCLGAGLMRIENNDIDSSGYLQGVMNVNYTNINADTRVTTNQGSSPSIYSTVYIKNNKVGVTTNRTGTVSAYRSIDIGYGYANLPTWNNNNIICGNKLQDGTTPAEFRINSHIGYSSDCGAVPNIPPVAHAGTDQTITLPANTVTQNGSGTDFDGTVAGYKWDWLSGPSQYTIVSPTQAQTVINNLVQGSYQFVLTVTDDQGAIGKDTVVIKVQAPAPPVNKLPVANAGNNQTITVPANSVTQQGSGSDADGTIASYKWVWISGPSQYTIVSPAQAQTVINNLVQGTYQFQLTVTDNQGGTAKDTVTIQVLAATPPANQLPVAHAGADQSITLPVNTATLSGSGTDGDGSVTGYQWTWVSGPSHYSIVSPRQAQTAINDLVEGTYTFRLTVTDNAGAQATDDVVIKVLHAVNVPPVANAGTDIITSETNNLGLNGSASYDPDGTIKTYAWSQQSGIGGVTITGASGATPTLYGLKPGVYLFVLTVTDNDDASATATVKVTVTNAAPPVTVQGPVAVAGADTSLVYPAFNAVTLDGSASHDAGGNITGYAWTQLSGPAAAHFDNALASATEARQLVVGVYKFELKVTDDNGKSATDTIVVTVNSDLRHNGYINLFPNPVPTGQQVTVQGENDYTGVVKYTVYDIAGRILKQLVRNKQSSAFQQAIPMENLQKGMYVLIIEFGTQRETYKVIVD